MTNGLAELISGDTVDVPTSLDELLTQQEEADLRSNLEQIAETRRLAAIDGASLRMA